MLVQKDGSPGKQEGNASTLAEAIEGILAMAGQEKVVLASTRSREPGHGCSVELQRALRISKKCLVNTGSTHYSC